MDSTDIEQQVTFTIQESSHNKVKNNNNNLNNNSHNKNNKTSRDMTLESRSGRGSNKKGRGGAKGRGGRGGGRGYNGKGHGNGKGKGGHGDKRDKGDKHWTSSTEDYVDYGSAGGIIIDPWNHPEHPERYNIFIIKQRSNSIWGLPKGHLEKGEEFEEAAMREVMEETGFDFNRLQEGTDYISVPINTQNQSHLAHRVKTHQIHVFIWLLLKPGRELPKHGRDRNEIQDSVWINTYRLRKLLADKNPNFMCNRTINEKIIYQIDKACRKSHDMLLEHHEYFNDRESQQATMTDSVISV